MKKFPALAAVGIAGLSLGAAAPSMAASGSTAPTKQAAAPTTGNLQHTPMQYWCNKGMPAYIVAVRAVKTPEKSVTFTETQLNETHTLGPVTHNKPLVIFSQINLAGKKVTLKVTGNTSGSTFSVSGTVPMTCAGLPKVQPNGTVTPAPGQTKPTPVTKPTMPTKTAPSPSMPGKTMGPKVQTDYVAPRSSVAPGEIAAASAALIAVGAAGFTVMRSRTR